MSSNVTRRLKHLYRTVQMNPPVEIPKYMTYDPYWGTLSDTSNPAVGVRNLSNNKVHSFLNAIRTNANTLTRIPINEGVRSSVQSLRGLWGIPMNTSVLKFAANVRMPFKKRVSIRHSIEPITMYEASVFGGPNRVPKDRKHMVSLVSTGHRGETSPLSQAPKLKSALKFLVNKPIEQYKRTNSNGIRYEYAMGPMSMNQANRVIDFINSSYGHAGIKRRPNLVKGPNPAKAARMSSTGRPFRKIGYTIGHK